jgi:2-polyprenyl-3-methyl-5-hydroxy-6-metoxy-1,4-benzoquinol methylase
MSSGYVAVIRDYYEQVWERLPDELEPPDFELRRRFLLGAIKPGDRALDLGCGAGAFTAVLASAGAKVIGADVAEAALSRARNAHPELDFRLTPIDGPLPFESHAFEVVWASEVIEHVADTERWLTELLRVLAAGGRLLLTTPNHPRAPLLIHGIERYSEPFGDHLHLYTRRALRDALQALGFEAIDVRSAAGPPMFRRLLLGTARRPG